MHAFIEKNRTVLLSFSYMLSSLLIAGYSVAYTNLDAGLADMTRASKYLRAEVDELKVREKKLKTKTSETKAGIDSLPSFLSSINSVAKANEVVIRRLTPDPSDPLKFVIEIMEDYFTFIRFALDLESRDVVISDMQVRPYKTGSVPPVHFISFSIIAHNDARENKSERIHALESRVEEKGKRNPFQRFAFDRSKREVKPEIDLTWVHRLTGVGRDGSGQRYATIDREDKVPGDRVEDKIVTTVESDRVYLERKGRDGTERFVLKFRSTS